MHTPEITRESTRPRTYTIEGGPVKLSDARAMRLPVCRLRECRENRQGAQIWSTNLLHGAHAIPVLSYCFSICLYPPVANAHEMSALWVTAAVQA